jgi:hypothetical protein
MQPFRCHISVVAAARVGRGQGPSAGGMCFTIESVLQFFPNEASYALTAMSDRVLAYSTEFLKHRQLVIYEAAPLVQHQGHD